MGMAASQARYLALVARKSNCEYEGQQINQARLALSNQSANLFNQMLGLSVPVPPSTTDFTKKQYSFSDGINNAVIDEWHQLAQPDSDGYNYVVDYYYSAEAYTGAQKKMNDPQVQFSVFGADIAENYKEQVKKIQNQLKEIESLTKDYEDKKAEYVKAKAQSTSLDTYQDRSTYTRISDCSYDEVSDKYTITYKATEGATEDSTAIFNIYSEAGASEDLKNAVAKLKECDKSIKDEDIYVSSDGTIALKSDLNSLIRADGTGGSETILSVYHAAGEPDEDSGATWKSVKSVLDELDKLNAEQIDAKSKLDIAQSVYKLMNVPEYIGNNQLTPLTELTEAQIAEIKQIIVDMNKQDVKTHFTEYFNPDTNEYNGGIYSFTLNGVTYYTTYDDLADSYKEGTGINNIDDQPKLAYYNASFQTTKIDKQDKAILETDSAGRFVSIRLSDNTVKYTLNVETITDEVAYKDAMNQYYYENAQYDKMVQDINAKTSIIQAEDRTLELRLKQLDTEQNALATEIDAVAKVVKDNVDKSFKTFGG